MGGDELHISPEEAASALRWWMEAGVDGAIQEEARNWLEKQERPAAPPSVAASPAPAPAEVVQLPADLDVFREWLVGSEAPLSAAGARSVGPQGAVEARLMLLGDIPGRDEVFDGRPIGGESWNLAQRMLSAIGLSPDETYFANLACFHSPGSTMSPELLESCARTARHHVGLVKPKLLLLFGDAPSRALIGKPLLQARGHIHQVEGVRTVATFHPRHLLNRPEHKPLAWKDLLLLTEDQS